VISSFLFIFIKGKEDPRLKNLLEILGGGVHLCLVGGSIPRPNTNISERNIRNLERQLRNCQ